MSDDIRHCALRAIVHTHLPNEAATTDPVGLQSTPVACSICWNNQQRHKLKKKDDGSNGGSGFEKQAPTRFSVDTECSGITRSSGTTRVQGCRIFIGYFNLAKTVKSIHRGFVRFEVYRSMNKHSAIEPPGNLQELTRVVCK